MYKSNSEPLVGELLSSATGLATAHTLYETSGCADIAELTPEGAADAWDGVVVDVGHYKEADVAIWSIMSVVEKGVHSIFAARMNRMDIAQSIAYGRIPIDVLSITDLGNDEYETVHFQGDTTTFMASDGANPEFGLTKKAIMQLKDRERIESLVSGLDTDIRVQQLDDPGKTIQEAIADDSTREILLALSKLNKDQRYVARRASEVEVGPSRSKTIELIAALDGLHEGLESGDVSGENIATANTGGTQNSNFWRMELSEDTVLVIAKTAHRQTVDTGTKLDMNIASLVMPPSSLSEEVGRVNYDYTVFVQNPNTGTGHLLGVNGRLLVVHDEEQLAQLYQYDVNENREAHEANLTAPETLLREQQAELVNGTSYLSPDGINKIIDLVEAAAAKGR